MYFDYTVLYLSYVIGWNSRYLARQLQMLNQLKKTAQSFAFALQNPQASQGLPGFLPLIVLQMPVKRLILMLNQKIPEYPRLLSLLETERALDGGDSDIRLIGIEHLQRYAQPKFGQ